MVLADLLEGHFHAPDPLGEGQVRKLADARRGVHANRALGEAPVDLTTQGVLVDAVFVVGVHWRDDHANHTAQWGCCHFFNHI